jgi:hypothetical protein
VSNLIETTFVAVGLMLLGLGWWMLRFRTWISRYGPIVAYVALAAFLYFIAAPIEWCLGLLPPINDPVYPTFLGIGGDAYGTDYTVYPRAVLYWGTMALLVMGSVETGFLWNGRRRISEGSRSMISFARPHPRTVNLCGLVLLFVAVAAFTEFFATTGWDRLVWSDLGRFEVIDGAAGMIKGVRWFLPVFITGGVLASLLLFLRGNVMLFGVSWILNAIPFLAFASRGFSILALAAGTAIFFRCRKYRKITILPIIAFVVLCAWLPLRLRQEPNTGLGVLWNVLTSQSHEADQFKGWRNTAVMILQNGGQGFGVFCQVVSDMDGPVQKTATLPPDYMLYSFSPLPSSLDGFAARFTDKDPRLNIFSPYCAFAELLVYSPFAFFGIPLLASLVSVGFLVQPRDANKLWFICSMLVSLLVINGCVQASQYATRTAGRFFYMAWFIGAAEWFFRRAQLTLTRTSQSLSRR